MSYSPEVAEKCLEHVVDMNSTSFDSLKRIHKYLHPALQCLDEHIAQDYSRGVLSLHE